MTTNHNTIEVMLLRWNEGQSGRTVTFLLPDDPGPHPFRGLKCGPAHGQRLGAAFVLIADDEATTPLEPPPQAPEKPARGTKANGGEKRRWEELPNSAQAALACKRIAFRRWLRSFHGGEAVIVGTEEDDAAQAIEAEASADRFVKLQLGIDSKSQLDSVPEHRENWPHFYSDFQFWLNQPDAP